MQIDDRALYFFKIFDKKYILSGGKPEDRGILAYYLNLGLITEDEIMVIKRPDPQ